jgi:integrase
MNQSFEKIERHLYRRQYRQSNGDWSTLYYAIFTDWKGVRRRFPVGQDLQGARDQLGVYRKRNDAEVDFDAEKKKIEEQKRRAITFSQWANRYFTDQLSPNALRPNSVDREKRSFTLLDSFFGDQPLVDIGRSTILQYRKKREVEGVGFITINRELSFLRKLLNVAASQDPNPIIEKVPRFKGLLIAEASRVRTGTVDTEEFGAIVAHMDRPAQRYLIALYETAMRRDEPRAVTWDKVDLKAGLIRLTADDVKEKYPRRTPISWELRQVLEELQAEQRRVPNVGGCVFTRKNGRQITSIRTAFERARHAAKLDRVILHDLRRTTISRWTDLGIPRDFVMAASGHKPSNVHDHYLNFTDKQLTNAFRIVMLPHENLFTSRLHGKEVENANAASY